MTTDDAPKVHATFRIKGPSGRRDRYLSGTVTYIDADFALVDVVTYPPAVPGRPLSDPTTTNHTIYRPQVRRSAPTWDTIANRLNQETDPS